MNKVNIVCVGKIKEKFYTDAVNEYIKRMSRFARFRLWNYASAKRRKRSATAF